MKGKIENKGKTFFYNNYEDSCSIATGRKIIKYNVKKERFSITTVNTKTRI